MSKPQNDDDELRISRRSPSGRQVPEEGSIAPPDSDLVDAHQRARQQRKVEQLKRARKQIEGLLAKREYEKAEVVFARNQAAIPRAEYDELVRQRRQRDQKEQEERDLRQELEQLLSEAKFAKADELCSARALISQEEYEKLKAVHIKKYLKRRLGFEVDDEKALALASCHRHLLITARAGSGKTTALACKTIMLMEAERVGADEIMILAFNRKAADEIRERVRDKFGGKTFWNARTFHSLAYQLAQPQKRLLFDEESEPSTRKQAAFIKDVLRRIWSPIFLLKMYSFFREEMKEVLSAAEHLSEDDYLTYRRNLVQVSLRGERIKSVGEKFIADFLCEHGIQYQYERVQFWKGHNYRPDFMIYWGGREIVLEHWGIDEADRIKTVPRHWTKTWEEYRNEMHEKRAYWKERGVRLIETSIGDLAAGREAFENELKEKLKRAGVRCERLSEAEIKKEIVQTRISHFVELCQQFILRAKKKGWSPEETKNRRAGYSANDERESVFLDLALKVYAAYQARLDREACFDFDDLIEEAAGKIGSLAGECRIGVRDKTTSLNRLKWIMVDEYQDFSRLFDGLISAIREQNDGVRLVCVGDDWQAINGFAGSDLAYFETFVPSLAGSGVTSLLTNYRSPRSIVEHGNEVMAGRGEPGRALPDKKDGKIFTAFADDVWVEAHGGADTKSEDRKYLFLDVAKDGKGLEKIRDDGLLKAKYLKKCHQIISQNLGKTIAIISRTRRVGSTALGDFKAKLKKCLSVDELQAMGNFEEKVRIDTAHRFKGLEADVVIILRACQGSFPLIHPDNCLFGLFGVTPQRVLDEERRLFYVAVTRAKEELWLLSERDRESDFLRTPRKASA